MVCVRRRWVADLKDPELGVLLLRCFGREELHDVIASCENITLQA